MYRVTFSEVQEIRMGSPFSLAKVTLEGDFVPDGIERYEFQNLHAVTPDGSVCYLVEWQLDGNDPGFRVWQLDALRRLFAHSTRIAGCCESIEIAPRGVK